ncbi:hypothetical protein KSP40_PGU012253 [Platanthera guangdongensis]|uniref:DUF7046 domain-containing protein n=1 Tax=Platanthera guangdongensis TaxID=2320717 RepID=A0ABR2LLY1_9ASPA
MAERNSVCFKLFLTSSSSISLNADLIQNTLFLLFILPQKFSELQAHVAMKIIVHLGLLPFGCYVWIKVMESYEDDPKLQKPIEARCFDIWEQAILAIKREGYSFSFNIWEQAIITSKVSYFTEVACSYALDSKINSAD